MKKKCFSPNCLLLAFLAITCLLSACENTSDCSSEEPVTQLNVRFFKYVNASQDDTASVLIKKIYAEGFPKAVFYENQYKTGVTLSLNPNADSTRFIIVYSYKTKPTTFATDTIRVKYHLNYQLASVNCHARINFSQFDTLAGSYILTSPFSFKRFSNNTIEIYAYKP